MTRPGPSLTNLLRDRSGLALIEFAIILPFMMLLYLGGFQVCDIIRCNRKVTIAARAIADLSSQYAILSGSTVDTILSASTQIMSPYSASNASLRVSEITTDSGGNAKVVWSRAQNGTALAQGTSVTIPAAMDFPNVSYIYGEVYYSYTPLYASFVPAKTLSQTIYMIPRVSTSISCSTC